MLRIAAAQTAGTRLDQWRETRELVGEMVARAAGERADIVLLPECVWPAYFMNSVDEYFQAREAGLPGPDAFLEQLTHLARKHDIAICAGHVAERGRRLANAATLVSATGEVLGTRHKCFLWDFDYTLFEPGSEISPVETPWGLVGLMICADARMPEIPATLVARGARLILQPTAWVNVGTPEKLWNPQPALLIPERAREFGVPIASASKWGREGETTFVGSSLICNPCGRAEAQCATDRTELITAEVELAKPWPVEMGRDQRDRLLSPEAAMAVSAQVPPLRVVRIENPAQCSADSSTLRQKASHEEILPTLFVASQPEPVAGDDVDWLLLTPASDNIHTLGEIRVAGIRAEDALSFSTIRALVLRGVHLVVVFGWYVGTDTLRSRAAENRIFVVQVTKTGLRGIDPRGCVIQTAEPSASATPCHELTLDVAQAADKNFAPRTDPFAARRPKCYEF